MIEFLLYTVLIGGYSTRYPSCVSEAIDFFRTNKEEFIKNSPGLSEEERKMAAAIVAPEVSTYSKVLNFVELRSMFVTYVYQGGGNFSVGVFQMKPSFAETIEKMARDNRMLGKEYSSWLKECEQGETLKDKRRARLNRLDDINWQIRYLTLFYRLADIKASKLNFKNKEEKLRYLATLYNSGINISYEKAVEKMSQKRFPHFNPEFNYADISVEFYDMIR